MSDLPEDRQLEETFRALFAASAALAAFGALDFRTTNEDGSIGEPKSLPALGIFAKRTGDNLNVTNATGPSADLELRLECRVDGSKPGSTETAERLAALVKQAVLDAPESAFAGLEMIDQVDFTDTERGFEDGTRVITHIVELVALRSALP